MITTDIIQSLYSELEDNNMKGCFVPVQHLQELKDDIFKQHDQGLFNKEFYDFALSFFSFQPPYNLPEASSLLIIAFQQMQTKISFTLKENTQVLYSPPIYNKFFEKEEEIERLVKSNVTSNGYHLEPAKLPCKLLAVRSGLAKYGRNNISYISGMGSFYQLKAFFTDVQCSEDSWQEPLVMERCKDCRICINKCPTGAIDTDRFLIHAEKCLTYHNERPSEFLFPDWINCEWHNSPVGCMLCQKFCPENKQFLDEYDGDVSFSNEETKMLLEGVAREKLSTELYKKIEQAGLLDFLEIFPRNLKEFF